MSKEVKLSTLQLFNEKFKELKNSGFPKNWLHKNINYEFDFLENKVKQDIPNQDEIKSFILTVRFFIQDNEPCSIRNMGTLYNELDIPNNLKDDFLALRDRINNFLDSKTHFGPKDKPQYTHRDIFESFIYGHFAHSNKEKHDTVKKWKQNKFLESHNYYYFIRILYVVFVILERMERINKETVKHVKAS